MSLTINPGPANQNGANQRKPNQIGPNQIGPNQIGPIQRGANQGGANPSGRNPSLANPNGPNPNGPNPSGPSPTFANGRVPAVQVPLPTRERRAGYIALAVALIIGLAAVGGYLYTQAGSKTPVVVVVRQVPVGHTIERSDLSTASVAGAITAIAGANLDSLVGQTATVTLLPHTLLQRAMVTDSTVLAAGQALVGVAVEPGQIPADGLNVGDTVEVLGLPGKEAAGVVPTVLVGSAAVYSTGPNPSSQGGTLLTLQVTAAEAPAVAAASNASLIALVKIGRS